MSFNNINEAMSDLSDLAKKTSNTDMEKIAYNSLGDLCKSYVILKTSGLPLDETTVDAFIDAFKKIGNTSPKRFFSGTGTVNANIKELIKLFKEEKTGLQLEPEDEGKSADAKGDARVRPIVIAVISALEKNDLDKSVILKNLVNNLSPADSVAAFDKYVEYLKHRVDEQREQIAKDYPIALSIDQLIDSKTNIPDEAKNSYKKIGYLTNRGTLNESFSTTLGKMLLRSLPYQEHDLAFSEKLKADGVVITEQRDAIAENFITNYKKNNEFDKKFSQVYDEMSTDSNILTQVFRINQQLKYGDKDQNDILDIHLEMLQDSTVNDHKYKNIIDQILFFAPMVRDNARIRFDTYSNMSKI